MKQYAPVLIPTLNRIDHLRTAIESLKKCTFAEDTDVFIALDYPPSEKYLEGYKNVCNFLEKEDHSVFKSFNVIKREENFGAAANIQALRESVFKQYDRIIIMEDDIEVSVNFLNYMNSALDYYEDDDSIIAISGYSYPVEWKHDRNTNAIKSNYIASVWGVGYWRDKCIQIYDRIKNRYMFNAFESAFKEKKTDLMSDACLMDYCSAYLSFIKTKGQVSSDSFFLRDTDVCLRAYLAIDDKYVVFPTKSHTRNHGFDGSGIICGMIIKEKEKEAFADNYDYDQQPIDSSLEYSFSPSDNNYLFDNFKLYNYFDRREEKEVRGLMKEVKQCVTYGPKLYRAKYNLECYSKAALNRIKRNK